MLGIDVGTTNIKAGLFALDGRVVKIAALPTMTRKTVHGQFYYEPEELWKTVATVIREVTAGRSPGEVAVIGVASMAESGVLIERGTGRPRSLFIPWFETCALEQAERIAGEADPVELFARTGLHKSFKYGLAKLLWLKEQDEEITDDAVWLSVSDYIAYRLTGRMATDYTLAARTYAFRLDEKRWDEDWIRHFGFQPSLFPEVGPSGRPVGGVLGEHLGLGLLAGTPVSVCGHDHVCASVAVGAIQPGLVFDSMGTAETLVGIIPERRLGEAEFRSGLSYGLHVLPGNGFWMGGISASGGSVEWLRGQVFEGESTYDDLLALLAEAKAGPTGILYFPYLSGSGAPKPDPKARGAFIGLGTAHHRSDLLKAVLEGTAYQMEAIRRAAERATDSTIEKILAVGGGTRNLHWMQIKADISGCRFDLSPVAEATLLGAAMTAAIGCGLYASAQEAVHAVASSQEIVSIEPNNEWNEQYQELFEGGYLSLQEPLRQFARR